MPTFSLTSHGVQAKLPLIRFRNGGTSSPAIGVFACKDGPYYIGIFLHQFSTQAALPLYGIGVPPSIYDQLRKAMKSCSRLVYVSPPPYSYGEQELTWPSDVGFVGADDELIAEWAEIYISHVHGGFPLSKPDARPDPHVRGGDFPVIPRWSVDALARAGFILDSDSMPSPTHGAIHPNVKVINDDYDDFESERTAGAWLRWRDPKGQAAFVVRLVAAFIGPPGQVEYSNLRAGVSFGDLESEDSEVIEMSKVDKWDGRTAVFGNGQMQISLMFSSAGRDLKTRLLEIVAQASVP